MSNVLGVSPWCQRGDHEKCTIKLADIGYPTCQCICHKETFQSTDQFKQPDYWPHATHVKE